MILVKITEPSGLVVEYITTVEDGDSGAGLSGAEVCGLTRLGILVLAPEVPEMMRLLDDIEEVT